jgi:dTDP-4-dehydrorhamnose 3,5-epimerase
MYARGIYCEMKFFETDLKGSYIIELEKIEDERGFFTRIWDKKIFQDKKLNSKLVQTSFSFNKKKGTIRGMHLQEKPFEETKIVRCTKGKIFDVIIDLRSNSKTYKKWISIELNSNNSKMIYIPEGFAHGFQTLEDNSEVFYQISEFYHPEYSKGIKWNDEEFGIQWPLRNSSISEKDLSYTPFNKY